MKNVGSAEDCHALPLGLSIAEGWNARAVEDAAFTATLNARLRSVVVGRIVPSLALMHREWKSIRSAAQPSREDIDAFAEAILGTDAEAADLLFRRLRERGFSVEELFENLLAPTARQLGELWAEDVCDFVAVTVGVNRLRIMLEIYASAPSHIGESRRCALLITTPSERHLFGVDVVATFLRSSGWDAVRSIGRDAEENARTVSEGWFAVVGVTIGEESRLDAAARAIEAVRRASVNRAIAVMAGGQALRGRPDLVARIGADAMANDGPSAVLLAQKLYLAQGAPARLKK